MKQQHSKVLTPEQKNLFVQYWMPDESPIAIVLLVHGLGEHSGRYGHWAERFVNKGIGFIAYDQQGHGRSEGKKGTPGNAALLVNDAAFMVAECKKTYPGLPLVLYGHSMGGPIALSLVLQDARAVNALVLTSPWIQLANPPSAVLKGLAAVLNVLVPNLTMDNGLNSSDISRIPEEAEAYTSDPLVHSKVAAGLFHTIDKAGKLALASAEKLECPTLLIHGTDDRITSWKASELFAGKNKDMVKLILVEGAFHELHHEPEREEVFAAILSWIKEKTGV